MRLKYHTSLSAEASFKRLGERIRAARKHKRLTLNDLENRCGVHRTTLSRLEAGDPSVSFAVLLAVLEALGFLSDIEAVISSPAKAIPAAKKIPELDRNF